MKRTRPPAGMTAHTASARVLARGGIDEASGEKLTPAALASRVAWCVALVRDMADGLTGAHWNSADVAELASGAGPDSRPLPSSAWMALRRLGWSTTALSGAVVSDRVARMAQEQAGRMLRSAHWRAALVAGIISTWPADPARRTPDEWDAVRAAVPGGEHLASGIINARTRQVSKHLNEHGLLPADLFELEQPPPAAGMLILAACDRQQATLERHHADQRTALLRVKLPAVPDPAAYQDWTWVAIPLALPPTVPAAAHLHLPTLRARNGQVQGEMAFTRQAPAPSRNGHEVALGIDWGLNTPLSAGAVRLRPDGTITALGAGAQYRASGAIAKAGRLRRQGEQLKAKADQYEKLTAGNASHPLAQPLAVLQAEFRHVSERRSRLNDALAWSAARWAADQAIAAGATVIYLEDLRSLKAGGMGKAMNTRLSQAARSSISDKIRHIAAENGIAVVTIPARGTSKHCPRCLAPLRHCKAPDRPATSGWKWASCPSCGWQGDRDQGAWQRIAARGLTHQAKTFTDRDTREMRIAKVDDELEAIARVETYTPARTGGPPETLVRDRSKAGPTRARTPRRAPRRRTAPSAPPRRAQRPEGHATTARRLPRAASRDQGVTATGTTPAPRPHRPRGAALGAGFHLNAHATPPREPVCDSPHRIITDR